MRGPAARWIVVALACSALLVAPLWIVHRPPLIDYPHHLARAFLMVHVDDPGAPWAEYYYVDWRTNPYLAMDAALVVLQQLFDIETAGRILLSLSVLAIPLGVWLFLRRANPGGEALALLAATLSYCPFFLWGFINYQLSIAVAFLTFALWLAWLDRSSPWRTIGLFVGVTALYCTHLFAFVLLGLLATGYCLLERRPLRQLLLTWSFFAPGGFLYWLANSPGAGFGPIYWPPPWDKLVNLFEPLRLYSRLGALGTLVVILGAFVAVRWRNPEFRWRRTWLRLTLAGVVLYFVLFDFRGNFMDRRLTPFLFVLALATVKVGRRTPVILAAAGLLLAIRTTDVVAHFAALQPELTRAEQSFPAIPARARVMPLIESRQEPFQLRPYAHYWAYGVIERGWFCPHLFHVRGVFLVGVRQASYIPPGTGWMHYEKPPDWERLRRDYDYVWAYNAARWAGDLTRIGDLVYSESDVAVYQLKK